MGDEEEKKFHRPSPLKPLAFVPPKPPVLQPNISHLLNNQGNINIAPPPPQLFANPFAPKKSPSPKPPSPPTPEPLVKPKDFGAPLLGVSTTHEIPITPIVDEAKQVTSPAYVEVSKQETIQSQPVEGEAKQPAGMFTDKVDMSGGLMGWLTKTMTESKILNDVAEKAKAGMETVMTTLDPGMKPFLAENGVIELTCLNGDADVLTAAQDGFEKAGALVIVRGSPRTTPLALVIGEKRAAEQCRKILEVGTSAESPVLVAVQPFLLEIEGRCYSTTKIMLQSGDVECEAIAQLLEIGEEVLEEIEKNAIGDDEYSIGPGEAVQRICDHQNMSAFRPGAKYPPYNSPELLVLAFASVAQQFLAKM